MAKAHRGQVLKKVPARSRGACPTCDRTGVKLLYKKQVGGIETKVCKHCRKRAA